MADYNEDKMRKMQDEMSRFEEEIGLPIPDMAPPLPSMPKVISASTYNEAQKQLAGIPTPSEPPPSSMVMMSNGGAGLIAPPPPPHIFVPHQVRAGGMDMRAPPPPPPPPPPSLPFPNQLFRGTGSMVPSGLPGLQSLAGFNPMALPPGAMSHSGGMGGSGMNASMMPPSMLDSYTQPPSFQQMAAPPQRYAAPPTTQEVPKPSQPPAAVLSATPMMYVANPQLEIAAVQAETPSRPSSYNDTSHEEKKTYTKNRRKDDKAIGFFDQYNFTPGKKKDKKNKKLIRVAGGQSWEDSTLGEWEEDDFRLFCGDLGNDVTDEVLTRAFSKYPSFLKARVVRDKRNNKTKGFGFVSFKDPQDFIRATKEMNGRYVGSRPIKLRKSTWKNRSLDVVKKKEKEKATLISMLTGR